MKPTADLQKVLEKVPLEVLLKDKSIPMVDAGVRAKTLSLLVASPYFDDLLLNPSGTHQQYLQKVDDTIKGNRNLQYLHKKFAEKGVPIRYSHDLTYVVGIPNVLVIYCLDIRAINYKLYVDDEDLLRVARNIGYEGDNLPEARQLVAQQQVRNVAGHEAYHHAFGKLLTPEQRDKWTKYVQQTNDPAIKSAINGLVSNPVYTHVCKALFSKQAWRKVANEIFAHRSEFHAVGPSGLRMMELPASAEELNLLKELGILPTDYIPTELLQKRLREYK